jgi:hypothetical protein
MDKVSQELRQMLLDIAYSVSDGEFLSFVAFAKLVVDVLEDAVEPERLLESEKADVVCQLWKEYAAGRRKAPAQLG